jgi:hypothetical protein
MGEQQLMWLQVIIKLQFQLQDMHIASIDLNQKLIG